jgi:hypothetical protein
VEKDERQLTLSHRQLSLEPLLGREATGEVHRVVGVRNAEGDLTVAAREALERKPEHALGRHRDAPPQLAIAALDVEQQRHRLGPKARLRRPAPLARLLRGDGRGEREQRRRQPTKNSDIGRAHGRAECTRTSSTAPRYGHPYETITSYRSVPPSFSGCRSYDADESDLTVVFDTQRELSDAQLKLNDLDRNVATSAAEREYVVGGTLRTDAAPAERR